MQSNFLLVTLVVALFLSAEALITARIGFGTRIVNKLFCEVSDSSPAPDATKGFGKPLEKKSDEPVEKDAGTMTYEAQQRRGIPEYNIFMR